MSRREREAVFVDRAPEQTNQRPMFSIGQFEGHLWRDGRLN
jgi:hypothetical protein